MWHLFKSRCSVIWREEVRNSTASMEPQNVSYWCVQICNRFKYAHLSLILSEMRMICEAKLYSTLSTHSLAPCRSPLCPKDWGLGWGRGVLPLMEFNDCSMSEEEAGGSVSYEVWVLPHSSATIIAALQQHWLIIDSPTVDVWVRVWLADSELRGGGHRNRQTFMGDDSLQISQSVQRHLGWQWGLPWNWRSQQPAFISSGLFFPREVQSPDSARLPNVSKHPPEPILLEYVTLMRKYFQKDRRIRWKVLVKSDLITHWRRSHISAFIKDVMFICGGAVMLMIIKELTRILMWPRSEEDTI